MTRRLHRLFLYCRRRWALTAWILLVLAVCIGFWRVEGLSRANKHRVAEIQQSRYESCRVTYESFHVIFDPFFPPPDKRTASQIRDFKKFDKIITSKIKQCRTQVLAPLNQGGEG